jgi:hypothetical protein
MRDIKHHKLNALPLTPYTQSRKPATPAAEKALSKKSMRRYFVGTGDDAS